MENITYFCYNGLNYFYYLKGLFANMNKQPKYTKHDFHVGQEVYVETIYGRGEGNIRTEIVEKVGHKYVTTNRDIYHLSDGRNKSEYAQCYELWVNLDEVSDKVLHDQLAQEIKNIFSTFSNSWTNQLTINDMEAILDIVRKAEVRNK